MACFHSTNRIHMSSVILSGAKDPCSSQRRVERRRVHRSFASLRVTIAVGCLMVAGCAWRIRPQKTLGTLFASPLLPLEQVLSASCCFSSWLSFWLPWIYSPFPFFMESCNGRLLQLIECIERTQNEVKQKMIESGARHDAPKSPGVHSRKKKFRDAIAVLI
jgi:hypothetical protein